MCDICSLVHYISKALSVFSHAYYSLLAKNLNCSDRGDSRQVTRSLKLFLAFAALDVFGDSRCRLPPACHGTGEIIDAIFH